MGARVLHRLDQLGDDVRRRRAVGIAHAEVDDVLAGAARLRLGRVDLGEHVGRQAADAVELTGWIGTHDGFSRLGVLLYQTRRAAATDRFGIDLHGGGGHAGRGQRRGHRLGARQAEGERRRLRRRVVRGGVAVAGDRDRCRCPRRAASAFSAVGAERRQLRRSRRRTSTLTASAGRPAGRRRRRRRRRGGAAWQWRGGGGAAGIRPVSRRQEPAVPAPRTPRQVGRRRGGGRQWRWRSPDGGRLRRGAGRRKRRALHRSDRRLGRRRAPSAARCCGWRRRRGRGRRGRRRPPPWRRSPAQSAGRRRGRWRRRRCPGRTAPAMRWASDGSGNRRRRRRVLRVGAVGDQRAGDVAERRAVRRRRLGRHGRQVGIGLVGAGRRRPLLGDLAALQAVPPAHRVDRGREATSSPPAAAPAAQRRAATQARRAGFARRDSA